MQSSRGSVAIGSSLATKSGLPALGSARPWAPRSRGRAPARGGVGPYEDEIEAGDDCGAGNAASEPKEAAPRRVASQGAWPPRCSGLPRAGPLEAKGQMKGFGTMLTTVGIHPAVAVVVVAVDSMLFRRNSSHRWDWLGSVRSRRDRLGCCGRPHPAPRIAAGRSVAGCWKGPRGGPAHGDPNAVAGRTCCRSRNSRCSHHVPSEART